ncbi:NusA protein [Candidatus Methanomethylophilus sp. 1R26]|jgi:N utilization substance protein A|uniref:NusA-like transcription termination signal-binding factor n=1 Tax=Candidatus Methanomethylophilus sp. 1R26 TaxID=1769296 RepID=UPI0007362D8C|nr:NusA-like transcription termination signal-binding factor [Candidatus Methanomethylophilus sp. 1R26]MCH3977569.1 NusA-like transcription termination signal-binding factor [Methanomethylophilus sp.]TQS77352.1 MAG: NusA protein [Methanomethylophilus alvi]WII08462.1 NusA-like transcription termination signal-binding factor [Methanomassiliicoccales archaeon LGM-DZ1]KUE74322.1 NusA protein [Candidatus Methanomethylophilus sp. 1R26]MCI2075057.1 NusA-like transcription termination signal-binding f
MSAENSKQEIVLTDDTLRYIALFQQLTHTNAVDCMDTPDKLVFVVEKGQGNIAVGKKGEHVIKLKEITGKNIQVVEYSDDPAQFVMNVFHVYKPQKVVIEKRGDINHATVTVDPELKGRAIGKAGRNLRIARDIVNRHHDIQSLSVE